MSALIQFDAGRVEQKLLSLYEKLKFRHPWEYAADQIRRNRQVMQEHGLLLNPTTMMRQTGKTTFGVLEALAKALVHNDDNGRQGKSVRIAIVPKDGPSEATQMNLASIARDMGNSHSRYLNVPYVLFHLVKNPAGYGIWLYAP